MLAAWLLTLRLATNKLIYSRPKEETFFVITINASPKHETYVILSKLRLVTQ